MTEFFLRAAEPDDLPQLIGLYVQLNPVNAELPDEVRVAGVFAEMLVRPGLRCVVAEASDNRIVGTCTLVIVPNLTHGARPFGVIENIVSDAGWRRQGVGSALIRNALEVAWAADCHKVILMSGVYRTEAHRFYERLGFVSDTKVGFVATPETCA